MAVKSGIWVKAHMRRCFSEGLTAVVARKGEESAGAIFVKVIMGDGRVKLYGPPPGSAYDEQGMRRWHVHFDGKDVPEDDADGYLARQANFDPDFWVIDIDDTTGNGLLDDAAQYLF